MYTYIMECQGLYKIGKATDVKRRLMEFRVGNPFIEHIKTIEGDYESYLHEYYKEKWVTGEWFRLTEGDIGNIEDKIVNIKPQSRGLTVHPNIQGCKCEKEYWAVVMTLKSLGIIDKRALIKEPETYDHEVWYKGQQISGCSSGATAKQIMHIKEKGKESKGKRGKVEHETSKI